MSYIVRTIIITKLITIRIRSLLATYWIFTTSSFKITTINLRQFTLMVRSQKIYMAVWDWNIWKQLRIRRSKAVCLRNTTQFHGPYWLLSPTNANVIVDLSISVYFCCWFIGSIFWSVCKLNLHAGLIQDCSLVTGIQPIFMRFLLVTMSKEDNVIQNLVFGLEYNFLNLLIYWMSSELFTTKLTSSLISE